MDHKLDRIPSLDGLRAVSILLVVLSHLVGTPGAPEFLSIVKDLDLGTLGVRVFFVISGFLITTILLREMRSTGAINLKNFYFRRTWRIFPAYYAYLFLILIFVGLPLKDLLFAATYTSNYDYPDRVWLTNHTWSLAVEEQFYLLWPMVLLWCGEKLGLRLALAFCLLAPFIRFFSYLWFPEVPIGDSFHTVADALAIGALLAGVNRAFQVPQAVILLIIGIVVAASALNGRPRISYLVGYSVMNFGIAAVLYWCVKNPKTFVVRVLNFAPLTFLGQMSYSLYLWQQPFLLKDGFITPLNLVLAFGAASLSYYLIERPGLAFRAYLEKR